MKTGNFPRAVIAQSQVPFEITEQDWLISITDYKGKDVLTDLQFGRTLFLQFNDINTVNGTELSFEDAVRIAAFIQEARQAEVNVWVNCHAGICRSGAIASLLIDLGWEDAKCHLSPGRIPNHLVYDRVRKHFPELKQSWD